jgi:hypothetical protein
MRRLLTAFALASATSALANDCDEVAAIPGAQTIQVGGDRIVLAPHPRARAQLCYENNAAKASHPEAWRVALGDFVVAGRIAVADAETITIEPPIGFMVFPADNAEADVVDGEALTVLIFSGLI